MMNSPVTGKPMKIIVEKQTIRIQGTKVKYSHYYWLCEDSGHKFTDTKMDEVNLENAYEVFHARKFNTEVAITIGICLLLIILAWELARVTYDIHLH